MNNRGDGALLFASDESMQRVWRKEFADYLL